MRTSKDRGPDKLSLELGTAQHLCETVNTPRSLTVWLLIEYSEWQQLVDLEIDPVNYKDRQHFADDYLVTECLKKSANLPLGVDRSAKAVDSFFESERRCAETNARILFDERRRSTPRIIQDVRRIISAVLGPLTRSDLEFVQSHFRFGPGATTAVRGTGSVPSDKYDEEIHLTSSLIPYYRAVLGNRWWSEKRTPVVVEGNRFTTVPKNAKTDRGICIEPTLNIYVQLGIGALLRRRLKRFGIDLSDQTKNQSFAKRAYRDGLATIDLSAASDSLSWGVVLTLLPPDWFELLDVARSPYTFIKDQYVELEKFSSMGNGYTFELETLIFAAVAHAVTNKERHPDVTCYGDDIILPQESAVSLVDALEYLGFSVNLRKSFLAGSFFESCGEDFFEGLPVRPFYLRQDPASVLPYTVQIANALRLYSHRRMLYMACDERFRPLWRELFQQSPSAWRKCKVPPSFGDTGFIMSLREARPRRAILNSDGAETPSQYSGGGWLVRHIAVSPRFRRKASFGVLLDRLARLQSRSDILPGFSLGNEEDGRPFTGLYPRRGLFGNVRPKWAIAVSWPDSFEWL